MAHGSKKWITDWRGRLKRSRNRTWIDWRAELARRSAAWQCDDCAGTMWWRQQCGECDRRWDVSCCHWWRKHTETRRMELRQRRNKVRNMLQRARYVPDLYDHIPTKHKNGWLD